MIEITTIYFVWLLRIFQPYLILSIKNLLSTKPLLNLPIVNRYTSFDVIKYNDVGWPLESQLNITVLMDVKRYEWMIINTSIYDIFNKTEIMPSLVPKI